MGIFELFVDGCRTGGLETDVLSEALEFVLKLGMAKEEAGKT